MRYDGEANSDAGDQVGHGVVEVVLRKPVDNREVLDQEFLKVRFRNFRNLTFQFRAFRGDAGGNFFELNITLL